ncbi:unnamed protein product [Cylindrotheca closterium]|uniref:HMG box domain-containing protein n=1 Tax=Cylindrotheca closterium TaxID=2856 RepID=A0AAD2CF66_9STRA|nr:unnamed protein product [Cylindrotheca closterium]
MSSTDVAKQGDSGGKPRKRARDDGTQQLKKAPQAPKRFRSSYICFFTAQRPHIKQLLGPKASITEISKRSAEMWKNLPVNQKQHWEEVAAKDKERFMNEKATYKGPWQVPSKRVRKDPSAPKRSMSAFLYFALIERPKIKEKNPDMANTDVSRLLGELWRAASKEEKLPFVEKEKKEREKYKVAMEEWKKQRESDQEEEHKKRKDLAASWNAYYTSQGVATSESEPPLMMTEQIYMPGPGGYPPYSYAHPQYVRQSGNIKQPVILGPNGMPVMMNLPPPAVTPMMNSRPPSNEGARPPSAAHVTPARYETTEAFEFPPAPPAPT